MRYEVVIIRNLNDRFFWQLKSHHRIIADSAVNPRKHVIEKMALPLAKQLKCKVSFCDLREESIE